VLLAAMVAVVPDRAGAGEDAWRLAEGARVELADVDRGAQILRTEDAFIQALSPLDRQLRLRVERAVSQQELLEFQATQVRPWTSPQSRKLAAAVAAIAEKLGTRQLPWPERIAVIQTTGLEEGDAAYCRGGAIVLPASKVALPERALENLLAHELFHILSAHHDQLRRRLYRIVGFEPCGEFELPPGLGPRRLTNPDAPRLDYAINLGDPAAPRFAVPLLYSERERYDARRGGGLFNYLTFKLLLVEKHQDHWRPSLVDGREALVDPDQEAEFHRQIGRNTTYIIHPEEILAENFVHWLNRRQDLPTPRILDELDRVLRSAE
jgi:hypothetical protein